MNVGKEAISGSDVVNEDFGLCTGNPSKTSKWARIKEIIWDGPRPAEEKKLVQRLDLFLMTWATYGYFVRLLDLETLVTNAYVSGMEEDLNIHGNQYNLLTTFFTCGYLVGQVPSQLLLTKFRPSYYLPAVELLWTILTFCFAAVQSTKQVFAIRFLVGMLEKLAKRIAIFYSASYAASMFSGYLQAGIYKGLDGHLGLPGWRWLFIFCGIISLPASIWGVYAIPDSPYTTRARWLPEASKQLYIDRMKKIDRRAPAQLSWGKIRKTFTHWPIYTISLMLIFHCLVTQPLNYFAVWLKSLNKFSVYQINLFPTAGQALGLVTTLAYAWVSDGLGGKRWQVMIVPATSNFVGMVIVASGTSYGATFFGYLINAATWGLWPVLYAWVNEICHDDAEERAIVIGVAQTLGQAFIAWVPVVILNVGKYAPQFKMGFTVMSVLSVGEFTMIFVIKWFVDRVRKRDVAAETANSGGQTGDDAQAITLKK
ncbi:retrograde regulation protein 2 [Hyaloscypha hepaticicola]|uniref:Retrograde regulation protein 2 n=1 Tax=Hyaloscypha hepaticicola TaxID=2082293 RepID=A0A2J6PPZ1_9HELO|nr:retrograde regulation protein 2 [Hyaloscypha hepaticicola]